MTTMEAPPFPLDETAGPGLDGDPDEVLLVVADWRSRCSACGGGATTTETAHSTQLPVHRGTVPERGCGRRYTAVACSDDAARSMPVMVNAIAAELGLPYVGRRPWPWGGAA